MKLKKNIALWLQMRRMKRLSNKNNGITLLSNENVLKAIEILKPIKDEQIKDKYEELLFNLIQSPKKGVDCPNCGKFSYNPDDILYCSQMMRAYYPEPHYEWLEIIRCPYCETIYQIENGS